MNAAAKAVAAERLELSRSPAAEVAAAALDAKTEAELDGAGADFIVAAVPRGQAVAALDAVRAALDELVIPA